MWDGRLALEAVHNLRRRRKRLLAVLRHDLPRTRSAGRQYRRLVWPQSQEGKERGWDLDEHAGLADRHVPQGVHDADEEQAWRTAASAGPARPPGAGR